MTRPGLSIEQRFWLKVEISRDGCWEWTANKDGGGYGALFAGQGQGKSQIKAHRLSWEIHNGRKLLKEEWVLHKCDNRGCVRPDHLFLGTQQDNMKDCAIKKRVYRPKLTEAQAVAIRQSSCGQRATAKQYGVSKSLVRAIRQGRAWRHAQ